MDYSTVLESQQLKVFCRQSHGMHIEDQLQQKFLQECHRSILWHSFWAYKRTWRRTHWTQNGAPLFHGEICPLRITREHGTADMSICWRNFYQHYRKKFCIKQKEINIKIKKNRRKAAVTIPPYLTYQFANLHDSLNF